MTRQESSCSICFQRLGFTSKTDQDDDVAEEIRSDLENKFTFGEDSLEVDVLFVFTPQTHVHVDIR